MQINKVLMYSDERVQVWVERTGFTAVFANAKIEKKLIEDQEDLFVLSMNGLAKLACEYMKELEPRLPARRRTTGPDLCGDAEGIFF